VVPDTKTRPAREVVTFGWSPAEFIRQGLLRFCFTDASDARNQLSFVEQRVRLQLARWAYPMEAEPGSVVLAPPPPGTGFNLGRILRERRADKRPGEGAAFRDFSDLVDFLTAQLVPEDGGLPDPGWTGSVAPTTLQAFIRRLAAQVQRIGHLVSSEVQDVRLEEPVTVVDVHALHDDAQRFVVGALLDRVFEEKQGQGREPLRFVVLDELNKYAPREGTSPIKDLLVDIAARGRSLGVLLIGAQQSAGDVEAAVVRNASVKVVGRLDAGESAEYRFLSPELRERAARFLPGTMVLDQPLIPAPIPIRFPFPAFATNVSEAAAVDPDTDAGEVAELFRGL
jgi:DNA helicase HerA-like ATPase